MEHKRTKRNCLLDDVIKAMNIELDRSFKSHNARNIYRVAVKWDNILRELVTIKIRGR